MTASGELLGRRYRLDRPLGGEGARERYLATDERLGRDVVAWWIEAPEDDPRRQQLLDVARTAARLTGLLPLRVLDIVPERYRLSVLLEAPPSEPARSLSGAEAAALATDLGVLLEEAEAEGFTPQRLGAEYVYSDDREIRVDPLGLLLARAAASLTPEQQLAALLLDLLDGARDAVAARVGAVAERWWEADRAPAGGLRAFLDDVRGAAGSSPAVAPAPLPAGWRDGGVPDLEDEPTEVMDLPVALEASPAASNGASAAPANAATSRPPRAPRPWLPWSRLIPVLAALLVVSLGTAAAFTFDGLGVEQAARDGDADDSGPPTEAPAPGQVTVGLAAQEDSTVRVTVDGVVEFDGVLRAGQRQSWEGTQRIQVWTDRGKTLLLSVNGEDLGPYSPAMGHPDWNRIDFGFWPGWPQ